MESGSLAEPLSNIFYINEIEHDFMVKYAAEINNLFVDQINEEFKKTHLKGTLSAVLPYFRQYRMVKIKETNCR